MIRDLEGLIKKLDDIYPTFTINMKKSEVKENPSFFIYDDDGEISKADTSTVQYKIKFYIYFITRENAKINKIKLIEMCKKHGLIFDYTTVELGKIENTDSEASMITFVFHQLQKVCYG